MALSTSTYYHKPLISRSLCIPADPAGRSNFVRLDLVGAKRRKDKIYRVPDDRLFFSHGVPLYLDFMCIMEKAVADGIRNRWVTKNLVPLIEGKLAGYDS